MPLRSPAIRGHGRRHKPLLLPLLQLPPCDGRANGPLGTFARDRFVIARGRLAEYRSSPKVTRGFCASCGTSLTYCHDKRANEIDLTLATLDDPSVLVPEAHIWVQDKLPWVIIGDGRPQFDTVRSDDA
jgi:hypothetical protein